MFNKNKTEIKKLFPYYDNCLLKKLTYHHKVTASVVQWSEFLATYTEVSGSIPGATRFSEQQWVWNGVHSASRSQLRSYLNKKQRLRSRKQRLTAVGIRCADHVTPLYLQKLALTSPTGGGRSVGIVRSRTKATEITTKYELKARFI